MANARWHTMQINNDPENLYYRKEMASGMVLLVLPKGAGWVWKVRGPERLGNGYLAEHARGESTNVPVAKKAADDAAISGRSLATV